MTGFPLCFRTAVLGMAVTCCTGLCAQEAPADSTSAAYTLVPTVSDASASLAPEEHFHGSQLVLPAGLVAVGTYGVYNGWAHRLRNDVRRQMDDWRGASGTTADNYAQYAPAALHLALGWAGVRGRHSTRDRVAAQATAWVAASILNNGMKYTIREPRPDTGRRNSFPSGHTVTAFTGAELTRIEYGTWAGVGAYAVATGVAVARLYNGRHWANDVLAGAGIGILSARIGYWMLPVERRWFGWSGQALVVPAYEPASQSVGLSLVLTP